MTPRRTDLAVAAVVVVTLVVGGILSWQAYRATSEHDQMMGSMMGTTGSMGYGVSPLGYAFVTLLVSAVLVGGYLVVRDGLPTEGATRPATGRDGAATGRDGAATGRDGAATGRTDAAVPSPDDDDTTATAAETTAQRPDRRLLDVLPEDERRVLGPVLTSPGITQIELRDRSDFSKSKVSQTVSALEKRGLLYRERQGRTYRVYPSDDLREMEA